MAASIVLSAVTLAADGKTITATLSGGDGAYAVGSIAGLAPLVTVTLWDNNQFAIPVASAAVAGTTLTIGLTSPVGTGETFKLSTTAAATLGDGSGNTVSPQSNLAVTNNSTVTVTVVAMSNAALELSGTFPKTPKYIRSNAAIAGGQGMTGVGNADSSTALAEFVTDATEIAAGVLSSAGIGGAVDDGLHVGITRNTLSTWCLAAITTAPLAAGQHLIRVYPGDYLYGFRIAGGTRSLTSVAKTKRTMQSSASGYYGIPAASEVFVSGARKNSGNAASADNPVNYTGYRFEFQFTGSGVEMGGTLHTGNAWAVSVDGAPTAPLVGGGDATLNNVNDWLPLATPVAGGTHTIKATYVGSGTNSDVRQVKIVNGTALAAGSAIGDSSVQVSDVSTIAVGDWVRIDKLSSREYRQVTGITGAGPYTLALAGAALRKAHVAGRPVVSYSAPAGTITPWQEKPLARGKVLAMGDSNTQGQNDYAANGVTDSAGNSYASYDPRAAPMYLAAQVLDLELLNLGIQGQTTAQMVARDADIVAFDRGGVDVVLIWSGTNDINATATTPAAYQASISSLITASLAALKVGGRVLVAPPGTPSGVTNTGGLNVTTATAACQAAVAAAADPRVVYLPDLLDNLVVADLNGVHFHLSGQQKVRDQLLPAFSTVPSQLLAAS